MKIIDTHCHLNMLNYEQLHKDVADVLNKAKARNVTHVINISCAPSYFLKDYPAYKDFPEVFFAVGIHPSYAHEEALDLDQLEQLLKNDRVVALGEIGLDDYWTDEHRSLQEEVYLKQLELAKKLDLPIIVHSRGTVGKQILDLIEQVGVTKGVIHCFTENTEIAQRAVKLGLHIGVGGVSTFKNAEALRETLRTVPVERIITETDSPYLAPVPNRGKENQPAYVADVVNYVSSLYGLTREEFAEKTYNNAVALFGLDRWIKD